MTNLLQKLKGSHKSATIRFNSTGLSILTIASHEPLLQAWLIEHNFVWVLIAGNIFLRFKTNSALEDKNIEEETSV